MPVTYTFRSAKSGSPFAKPFPPGDTAGVKGARAVLRDPKLVAFLDAFEDMLHDAPRTTGMMRR